MFAKLHGLQQRIHKQGALHYSKPNDHKRPGVDSPDLLQSHSFLEEESLPLILDFLFFFLLFGRFLPFSELLFSLLEVFN